MKQNDLDKLAVFAGLVRHSWKLPDNTEYGEWYKDGMPYCLGKDWQPHLPGHAEQMMLILEALVKDTADRGKMREHMAWCYWLRRFSDIAYNGGKRLSFDLPAAVCQDALAVIAKGE